jgi:hypothetical protein
MNHQKTQRLPGFVLLCNRIDGVSEKSKRVYRVDVEPLMIEMPRFEHMGVCPIIP